MAETFIDRVRTAVTDSWGLSVENIEEREHLQEAYTDAVADARMYKRELEDLAYSTLDYSGGRPTELLSAKRRELAQKHRVAFIHDPHAGAAIDMLNYFVWGRGAPEPSAKDPQVQEAITEAWGDPDNQAVLTSFQAQLALGVDLCTQNNLFVLMYDDGDDGRVKLSILDHDSVEDAVVDEDNEYRVLYYLTKRRKMAWNYELDRLMPVEGETETLYYPHWCNVELAEKEAKDSSKPPPKKPPKDKIGKGKVYHIALNRGSSQVFGVPEISRTLRWFNAFNRFLESRVDMAQAAAAWIAKRKVQGTPNQVRRLAEQALSRSSRIGAAAMTDPDKMSPPSAASILTENQATSMESFKLDSGAAGAAEDAKMLRAPISVGTGFPPHYLGDPSQTSLATASSLEIVVVKKVEARQELFEGLVRWFLDRVIERAIETKKIKTAGDNKQIQEDAATGKGSAAFNGKAGDRPKSKERDLSYKFSLPSPLRRTMVDLVNAATNTLKTFDPNNTNLELSRVFLTILLGEAFEVEKPADEVDRVFPEGYVDPATQAPEPPPPDQGQGQGSAETGPQGEANPYGAKQKGAQDKNVQQSRFEDLPADIQNEVRRRNEASRLEFAKEATAVIRKELAGVK